MSRRYPVEKTKRYRLFQIMAQYTVINHSLPTMSACHRICNKELAANEERTISWPVFYQYLQTLCYRDKLINIDAEYNTVSIAPCEVILFEDVI